MRLSVRRAHGKVSYPTAHERALSLDLPPRPAAVRVYGPDGCCRAIFFDIDAKGDHDAAGAERDYTYLTRLLAVLGLRWIEDRSPTGGRHVYLPLDFRLPLDSARDLLEGLARRFPTLDPSPHRSALTGCVRPPGAPHASGGYQELTQPLWAAQAALERPCSAEEFAELRAAVAGDVEAARAARAAAAVAELDVDVLSSGQPSPLSARLAAIARHGDWDEQRYGSDRSAARQAVITGYVANGWLVTDVLQEIHSGRVPGLAGMYAKYATAAQRIRAVRADVASARSYLAAKEAAGTARAEAVRISNTSARLSRGGDEHGYIRMWRSALMTLEMNHFPGRSWIAGRFVLRALAEAAHKTGDREVAFGCRSLAEASGIDHSTVSLALKRLEESGWVKKTRQGWGEAADAYELTLPQSVQDLARDMPWPRGKIHALRPVFRELGHVCALVYESIETERATSVQELSRRLRLSRSATHDSVEMLTAWGIVERRAGRLAARPDQLSVVARYVGADDELNAVRLKHRRQRALWRAWLARFENDDFVDVLSGRADVDDIVDMFEIEAA